MPKWGYVFLVFIIIGVVATVVTFLVIRANPFKSAETSKEQSVSVGPAGILISEDGGATWTILKGSEGVEPLAFAFRSGSTSNFYVGSKGAGLWILKSGSDTLERVNDPSGTLRSDADVYAITETPSGDVLYLGVLQNDRGQLLRLTEDSSEEIYTTALDKYPVLAVFVDPLDPLHINFIAEGAFYEARDGGKSKSWEPLARVKDGFVKLAAGSVDGKLFALDGKNTLFVTKTGGRIWNEAPPISVDKSKIKRVNDFRYNYLRKSLVVASDYGLLETYDDGESWIAFRTPVPPRTLEITAFAPHPRFEEVMWMSAERLVYRTDDGISWSGVDLPTEGKARLLAADPSNPKRIYAGISK